MSGIDYTASITATANQYGVPPSLALAVAQIESSMNPTARSSAGAIGLFQLMPSTAAGLGVDPNDPLQNIQGGVEYLSQLLTQYNGDTSLALAAYNAGPGNVAKYGGIPPFQETINYVQNVLSQMVSFGGGTDTTTEDSTNSIDSGVGDSINTVADSIGVDPTVIVASEIIAGLVGVFFLVK